MPDMLVRGVNADTLEQFRNAARVRGWTYAQYIEALVTLHEVMRQTAAVDQRRSTLLESLGLQTREG